MDTHESNPYLLFQLQEELFAVKIDFVVEIIETVDKHIITNLKHAPNTIAGVINFKGNVIPVINTRIKFNMEEYCGEEKELTIVLNIKNKNKGFTFGILTDKIIDVIEISDNDIKPINDLELDSITEYFLGVINRNNFFIKIINLYKTIENTEIIMLKHEHA